MYSTPLATRQVLAAHRLVAANSRGLPVAISSAHGVYVCGVHHVVDPWRCYQLSFMETLASRTVKQNRIAVRFPNRREIQRPWPIQAKVYAARRAVSHEDSLLEWKQVFFESVLFAESFGYVFAYGV